MRAIVIVTDPNVRRLSGHPIAIVNHLNGTILIAPGIRPVFRTYILRHEWYHLRIAAAHGLFSRRSAWEHALLDVLDGFRFPVHVVRFYAKRSRL